MKASIVILALAAVFCTGCSNAPVQSSEYLLRPGESPAGTAGSSATIALGSVSVPPYLDQQGLVLEIAPNEINAARNHRWAEPLSYSVQRYLQVAIGRASGLEIGGRLTPNLEVERQIDVLIHQLHATYTGEVRLIAEWRILEKESETELVHRNFSATETLSVDGYPAVVRAHEALLNRLAAAIGAELVNEE